MTSRPPYWFVETKKRRPYWILWILSSFLHDVTAAILVCWNKETTAILDCSTWKLLRMTIRSPYWFSKTKTWLPYCISLIWKKKNAYDVTTAMVVQWNNQTMKRRPFWIVLVCKNMHMTSPCQRCVTYQPLGIQVYFNAKILFCSSDQRDKAFLISGKSNSIVFFCFLSSVLQFIQIQFSNLIKFSLKILTAP